MDGKQEQASPARPQFLSRESAGAWALSRRLDHCGYGETSYGVGITAVTWLEYALSIPVLDTSVTT